MVNRAYGSFNITSATKSACAQVYGALPLANQPNHPSIHPPFSNSKVSRQTKQASSQAAKQSRSQSLDARRRRAATAGHYQKRSAKKLSLRRHVKRRALSKTNRKNTPERVFTRAADNDQAKPAQLGSAEKFLNKCEK